MTKRVFEYNEILPVSDRRIRHYLRKKYGVEDVRITRRYMRNEMIVEVNDEEDRMTNITPEQLKEELLSSTEIYIYVAVPARKKAIRKVTEAVGVECVDVILDEEGKLVGAVFNVELDKEQKRALLGLIGKRYIRLKEEVD